MAVGTLWVFGDSFDYAYELTNENHEYYKKYKTPENKHYSEHIADKYDLDIQTIAFPGHGSANILYYLSKGLPHIKENDYVILGMSDVNRLPGFEPINDGGYYMASFSVWYNKEDQEIMKPLSNSFYQTLERYTIDCIEPVHHYYAEFYYRIFSNILKSVKCKKVFGYTTDEWGLHENIHTHTNGEIENYHWSFDGSKSFAEKIIKIWETEDFHFEPNKLNKKFYDIPLGFPKRFSIL